MFEFEEDGELFHEKCVYGFLPELFERWKKINANHVVRYVAILLLCFYISIRFSLVFFSRVRYNELKETDTPAKSEPGNITSRYTHAYNYHSSDPSGRLFRDFYRVIVDSEIRPDWSVILKMLRRELMDFQREILQQQVSSMKLCI